MFTLIKYADIEALLECIIASATFNQALAIKKIQDLTNGRAYDYDKTWFDSIKYAAHIRGEKGLYHESPHTIVRENTGQSVEIVVEPKINFGNVEGWEQETFLYYHCFFLIKFYYKFVHERAAHLVVNNQSIKIEGKKTIFIDAIKEELWVTLNALLIKQTYTAIYQGGTSLSSIEQPLVVFAKELLISIKEIMRQLPLGWEICVPTGYAGHSIYLNFIKTQDEADQDALLLRLDNAGAGNDYHLAQKQLPLDAEKIPPFSLGIIPLRAKTEGENSIDEGDKLVVDYLSQIFEAKFLGKERSIHALHKIYDQNSDFNTKKLPKIAENYFESAPELKKQINGNCVFINFKVGMHYRLLGRGGFQDTLFLNWFCSEELREAIVAKEGGEKKQADHFEKIQIARRKEEKDRQKKQNTSNALIPRSIGVEHDIDGKKEAISLEQKLQQRLLRSYQNYRSLPQKFPSSSNNNPNMQNNFIDVNLTQHNHFRREFISQDIAIGVADLFNTLFLHPNRCSRILLYGSSGIGKSLICRYLATQWQNNPRLFRRFKAVFWLSLSEAVDILSPSGTEKTSRQILLHLLYAKYLSGNTQLAEREIDSWLNKEQNNILFILDDYDDIPQPRPLLLKQLLKSLLADLSFSPSILFISRTASISPLEREDIYFNSKVECTGFNNESIQAFVYNYFSDFQHAEEFLCFLHRQHQNIKNSMNVPLYLEALCGLWQLNSFEKHPVTLTQLYKLITDKIGAVSQCRQEKFKEYFTACNLAAQFSRASFKEENISTEDDEVIAKIKIRPYEIDYQLIWQLTAGLLYENTINSKDKKARKNALSAISDFFGMLQNGPVDLSGNFPVQLLMLCLEECPIDTVKCPRLKKIIKKQIAAVIVKLQQGNLFSVSLQKTLEMCTRLLGAREFYEGFNSLFKENNVDHPLFYLLIRYGILGDGQFNQLIEKLNDETVPPHVRESIAKALTHRESITSEQCVLLLRVVTNKKCNALKMQKAVALALGQNVGSIILKDNNFLKLSTAVVWKQFAIGFTRSSQGILQYFASQICPLLLDENRCLEKREILAKKVVEEAFLINSAFYTLFKLLIDNTLSPSISAIIKQALERRTFSQASFYSLYQLLSDDTEAFPDLASVAFCASQYLNFTPEQINYFLNLLLIKTVSLKIKVAIIKGLLERGTLSTSIIFTLLLILGNSGITEEIQKEIGTGLFARPVLASKEFGGLISIVSTEIDSLATRINTYNNLFVYLDINQELFDYFLTLSNKEENSQEYAEIFLWLLKGMPEKWIQKIQLTTYQQAFTKILTGIAEVTVVRWCAFIQILNNDNLARDIRLELIEQLIKTRKLTKEQNSELASLRTFIVTGDIVTPENSSGWSYTKIAVVGVASLSTILLSAAVGATATICVIYLTGKTTATFGAAAGVSYGIYALRAVFGGGLGGAGGIILAAFQKDLLFNMLADPTRSSEERYQFALYLRQASDLTETQRSELAPWLETFQADEEHYTKVANILKSSPTELNTEAVNLLYSINLIEYERLILDFTTQNLKAELLMHWVDILLEYALPHIHSLILDLPGFGQRYLTNSTSKKLTGLWQESSQNVLVTQLFLAWYIENPQLFKEKMNVDVAEIFIRFLPQMLDNSAIITSLANHSADHIELCIHLEQSTLVMNIAKQSMHDCFAKLDLTYIPKDIGFAYTQLREWIDSLSQEQVVRVSSTPPARDSFFNIFGSFFSASNPSLSLSIGLDSAANLNPLLISNFPSVPLLKESEEEKKSLIKSMGNT